uniref:NADH-ubiquinone oxidoreductase chain 4 n=1 Tax=Sinohyriopsis cumingii TaxID=165450 RepID=A0A0C4G397_SINCU|nr:NADH dehydrogenase subunit 4 [Sinohyriopsis cumingii]
MIFNAFLLVLSGVLVLCYSSSVSWWVVVWGSQVSSVMVILWSFSGVGVVACDGGGVFCYDEVSSWLIWLTFFIAGLSLLGSNSILLEKASEKAFLCFVVGLVTILGMCFAVDSLFLFYVFFEFSLIPTFAVIGGWGYQPERLRASKYIVLYTVSASLPLLVFVLFIFWGEGSDSLTLLKVRGGLLVSSMVFFVVILAFLVKSPAYGVHMWLPKAHVEAPVAGSMFLAGILLKLGGYGLIRFMGLLKLSSSLVLGGVVCLCVFGGFVASVVCCAQVDGKSLVAYSSVGHMSLVLGGLVCGSYCGMAGGFLLMIAHGLSSCGLFFLVGELYKLYVSRMLFVIRGGIGGLFGINVWLAMMCSFNAAAPPSLNLFSEIVLCVSLVSCYPGFGVIFGALGFLSCLYSWLFYCSTQIGLYPLWARSCHSVSQFHVQGVVCSSIVLSLVGLCVFCGLGKFS